MIPLTAEQILDSSAGSNVVDAFNDLYYTSGVAGTLNWCGLPLLKNPCDLWMMLELIQTVRPAVIIETGTHFGGSAVFFADMTALLGIHCHVVTIDINPKWNFDPATKNIRSIVGYSTDPSIVAQVRAIGESVSSPVIVVLDSDHSQQNVAEELRLYSPLVTLGSYLVVEDTNVNGHPSFRTHGPGPYEAVQQFVARNPHFVIDNQCERHLLTFNPNGWLRRVV
jgi:cephalosporin hydroxylase